MNFSKNLKTLLVSSALSLFAVTCASENTAEPQKEEHSEKAPEGTKLFFSSNSASFDSANGDVDVDSDFEDENGFSLILSVLGQLTQSHNAVGLDARIAYAYESFVVGLDLLAAYNFARNSGSESKDGFGLLPALFVGLRSCDGLPHGVDLLVGGDFSFVDGKDKYQGLFFGAVVRYYLTRQIAAFLRSEIRMTTADKKNGFSAGKDKTVFNASVGGGISVDAF